MNYHIFICLHFAAPQWLFYASTSLILLDILLLTGQVVAFGHFRLLLLGVTNALLVAGAYYGALSA
jgi:hypothetical protein